ncbi:MAG: alanine racemase [Opitutae bacterium]|nr:alanine racemase [Opitutae bacterium]
MNSPEDSVAPSGFAAALALRPAWVEIDVAQWRRNWALIRAEMPHGLGFIAVVKDDAYGHGMLIAARLAFEHGALALAVPTLAEAVALREAGLDAPILLLGPRHPSELDLCVRHALTCTIAEEADIAPLASAAARAGRQAAVHLKINTGMNRYGVAPENAVALAHAILAEPALRLEGVFSHFAQSDERDKTFADVQLERFRSALAQLAAAGVRVPRRHLCNSGGYLDLPRAHFDAVRLGILPLGVYPSQVCRRIPGLAPVLSVKARIAALQSLAPGEHVGYGMRFTAATPRRIAVLPLGYGDGFPRVRNEGDVLLRGRRAPIVGGVSMDALFVDVTDVPGVERGDVATLLGRDGAEEITAHDLAALKRSVSYDLLCAWRARLPRHMSRASG